VRRGEKGDGWSTADRLDNPASAVLIHPAVASLIRFYSLNDDMLRLRPDVAAL